MKKITFVLFVIISIFVINSLLRSIFNLWHKKDLVTVAQKELNKELEENKKLKSQLSFVESKEFVEEAARNKLFMVLPGEQKVLIDKNSSDSTSSARKEQQGSPNWKKWWELFF